MTRLFARSCSQIALGLFRAFDGDRLTGMSTDDLKHLRDAIWPPDDVIDGIFREEVDAELHRRGEVLDCVTASDMINKRTEPAQHTVNHLRNGAPESLMRRIGRRVGTPCVPSDTGKGLGALAPD